MPVLASGLPLPRPRFRGPRVVRGAFVLAVFGWGVGFYGPPIFLHSVVARTGWPLAFVSLAVTLHFVIGAVVVAGLPRLYRRCGLPAVTMVGASATAFGVLGWAAAVAPWQLLVAAAVSGAGWVTLGAAAVNAIVAPWYVRGRPLALGRAYNGASVGGMIFSPLWVALIGREGFVAAAALVGAVMVAVVAVLARTVFATTPAEVGQLPDGEARGAAAPPAASQPRLRWRDRRFLTLASAMAASLFAQIGLVAHLFGLLVPVAGAQTAGLIMGGATGCGLVGRSVAARFMVAGIDRRLIACAGYALQVAGALVLLAADGSSLGPIVIGVALFGSGIGNATSVPPLIAQVEFAEADVQRAIAWMVAAAQAAYAFAPATFGLLLAASMHGPPRIGQGAAALLASAALVYAVAIACIVAGRRTSA